MDNRRSSTLRYRLVRNGVSVHGCWVRCSDLKGTHVILLPSADCIQKHNGLDNDLMDERQDNDDEKMVKEGNTSEEVQRIRDAEGIARKLQHVDCNFDGNPHVRILEVVQQLMVRKKLRLL